MRRRNRRISPNPRTAFQFTFTKEPYYAWSQRANTPIYLRIGSALEFWEWFDGRCNKEERAYINGAPNGQAVLLSIQTVIQRQGGWAKCQEA